MAGFYTLDAMAIWTPDSWRSVDLRKQQPTWPNQDDLLEVVKELRTRPPLIYAGEARQLKTELARAAAGDAFVLQAGDCAETFAEFSADRLKNNLKVILQMAVVLTYSSGVHTVKIGRVAGQFAKPRTCDTETVGGVTLPAYRGDMVNRVDFDPEARRPSPRNLLKAYDQAAMTLNLLRGFATGGFADLSKVHEWNREFVASLPEGKRYESIALGIDRALQFMRACQIDAPSLHTVDLYASHEALILEYEEALTRQDSTANDAWYACSGHMLWIGARTRDPGGPQAEYLRGVGNPVGVKVDASTEPKELVELCDLLDPNREPGRLTLISRMGSGRVSEALPPLLEAVRASGHPVLWLCDPMHGNTFTSGSLKTRHFDDILTEIERYFQVHSAAGTWPGGLHLELTGENVTECLGGSDDIDHEELPNDYRSACDPRLNARQSLDLAFRVAELLHG
jgi:3-deoxy-7-phosphoheptulonate synthase